MDYIEFSHYKVPVVFTSLSESFGEFSFYPYPEIRIDTGLKAEIQTSTILHEVMEMISEIYGLNLEESQIRTLEVSLMSVFFRNPWFMERLQKGAEKPVCDLGSFTLPDTLPDSPEAL